MGKEAGKDLFVLHKLKQNIEISGRYDASILFFSLVMLFYKHRCTRGTNEIK